MNHLEKETLQIRELLRPIIGETNVITYFSYYGIQKNELMFALYKNKKFYLKLSPHDIPYALMQQGVESLVDPNIAASHKYYLLPDSLLSHLTHYAFWFTNSLAYIQQNKHASYSYKKKQIRSLPNMNYQLERKLRKIHIYSIEELIAKGEIDTFVDLIRIGEEANHMTLFKLYGAIHHKFIYTLSPTIQQNLLNEVDDALYLAGFRRRFSVKT
ncbi:hypothetical protein A6B43_03920 [Vespertiliibacter pulmonis]|uniref:Regulator of competence-specific genes n=1 Tax=Vespertiliibacter pulmonis TaxID=1443036 RepID=A0A3N4VMJ9_9PAST|nr:TfoX/Sxy family protein [Vespertiliibacter pulmonis]QLB20730.1 hypothetical protein A6B43_03920 [Vespertiliibacter pulmonis]RPE82615.1 regulator of competence-specific genes [Vespertiliibacter pulmonis]